MAGPFVPPVQTDQFNQSPVAGDLDLAIMHSGVLTGVLSASVVVQLVAGSRVKLDDSVATPGSLPAFVAAADNEAATGVIKRTAQKASFTGGDVIEVVFAGNPSVIWEVAGATVSPNDDVEMAAGFVQPKAAGALMGKSLDYAVVSTMVRVILGFVAC